MFAGPALADTQELVVTPYNTTPGVKAETDIDVAVPTTSAPTAKVAVYVPAGYSLDVGAAPGTKIGDAALVLNAKQLAGTNVTASGTITADDPAKYVANTQAQACAAGQHAAVWHVTSAQSSSRRTWT